jgi:carbamoyltransferase
VPSGARTVAERARAVATKWRRRQGSRPWRHSAIPRQVSGPVLGLNVYHADSSACLVADGEVIAAAEEERFNRIKHWAGFPAEAIRYCLDEAGLSLHDVTDVAVNRNTRANLGRKVAYSLGRRPSLRLVVDRLRNAQAWRGVEDELRQAFPDQRFGGTVHHVEHHLAHVASSFLVCPYEDAVAVSVDSFGDFASTAWGLGRRGDVAIEGRVYFPHSLGIFYTALTQFLGFPNYGDEYKVMGLAPYGGPEYMQELRRVLRHGDGAFRLELGYFRHHREDIGYRWRNCAPSVEALYTPRLEELLGPARDREEELEDRHRGLARSLQELFEESLFDLLNRLHARYGCDALVLSGGCAMNSVAAGKVPERSPFTRVYVPPAPGDAGGAIGAALWVWTRLNGRRRPEPMNHAALGPAYSSKTIADLVTDRRDALERNGCRVAHVGDEGALCARVAEAIANGDVVGWFHGRMEWGPRALGNRSILCDPRRADMKQILNRKIKRRESFRPFAPSVLREAVGEWFERDDDVPFMSKVLEVRSEKRSLVPAVVHVDGTGRLQTVDRASNPRYYDLLKSFDRLTGVPMVLNTSFNENEPIVDRPEQALECFLRTRMDMLVLEQYVLTRSEPR